MHTEEPRPGHEPPGVLRLDADCMVCAGRGRVRLPIYSGVTAAIAADISAEASCHFREYPCPECGDKASSERVAILRAHSEISCEIDAPGFQDHVRNGVAHRLVEQLLEQSFISFKEGPPSTYRATYILTATLGAISPTAVATFEQRVAAASTDIAQEVAKEANRQIANWGSYYHGESGSILKSRAIDAVNTALRDILSKHSV